MEVQTNPLIDLHFFVRAIASGDAPSPGIAALDEAAKVARELETELGSPLGWGLLEGNLPAARSAAELVDVFGRLPERFELRLTGKSIAPRAGAVRFARALLAAEEAFLAQVWPRHQEALTRASGALARTLAPRERACFDFIHQHLGLELPAEPLPVALVAQGPRPQGFTFRRPGGRTLSVIAVEGRPELLVLETVLHEAIHALEVHSGGRGSALDQLRARLGAGGVTDADPLSREAIHGLIFIQAGETVRRLVDPSHRHYGEVAGVYAKAQRSASVELPIWKDYLDGKLTRDAAIERIATELLAKHPPAPAAP
ncbi:hypothetical protein [Chondromyces apiculatus]|nr:hypothetical protein [Chondromyces apiculatus]